MRRHQENPRWYQGTHWSAAQIVSEARRRLQQIDDPQGDSYLDRFTLEGWKSKSHLLDAANKLEGDGYWCEVLAWQTRPGNPNKANFRLWPADRRPGTSDLVDLSHPIMKHYAQWVRRPGGLLVDGDRRGLTITVADGTYTVVASDGEIVIPTKELDAT